ncbi:MAG: hypothetical protein QOC73_1720 [Actinomycetota bacterium]|jgi:hypothetical protein|nr:hypothetical protein [Actinomycetota bacterium]MDQ1541526.1 hypothetical protein [Actinomycetota bacterium]
MANVAAMSIELGAGTAAALITTTNGYLPAG